MNTKLVTASELEHKALAELKEGIRREKASFRETRQRIAEVYRLLPELLAEGFRVQEFQYMQYWNGRTLTIELPRMPSPERDVTLHREWVGKRAKLREILGSEFVSEGSQLLPENEQPKREKKGQHVRPLVKVEMRVKEKPYVSVEWVQELPKESKCKVKAIREKASVRKVLVCENQKQKTRKNWF